MSTPVKSPEINTQAFEDQLLAVKAKIQVDLVEKEFGEQPEEINRIIVWISKYGSTIDTIFHENPSLVYEFATNPDGVFDIVKSKLEK